MADINWYWAGFFDCKIYSDCRCYAAESVLWVLDVGESAVDILISGFCVERQQRYVTVLDFGFWNKGEIEGK